MSRFASLFRKDMRVVLRSRLLLVVLVLYPLVIVSIIGYAFSDPKQKIPLAVVNNDIDGSGQPNEALIEDPFTQGQPTGRPVNSGEIIAELEKLTDVKRIDGVAEARQLLLTGDVQAVVVVPQGFVDRVVQFGNGSARLEVLVDQSDPVRATIMETGIRGVVQEFQEFVIEEKVNIVVEALEDSLRRDLPVDHFVYPGFDIVIEELKEIRGQGDLTPEQREDLDRAIAFLENLRLGVFNAIDVVKSVAQPVILDLQQEQSGRLFIRDLIIPAALGLSIFWTGSLATAALIVYERESPAFVRLGVTPVGRLSILLSKVTLTTIIILFQSAIILLAAVLLFRTRVDNMPLTLVLILLSTLASIAIGIFLSGVTRDVNGAVLLSVLVTFPMLFLAGLFYPVDFMPEGAQVLARFFPLTYTVSGLRGSMLRGFGFEDAILHIAALAFMGILLTVLGVILGRRFEGKN